MADISKLTERTIPGMNRSARFAAVEYAQDVRGTLRRILGYFAREKRLVAAMLAVVLLGTLCGICAPRLQSDCIDIIAGEGTGVLGRSLVLMLALYLLYSASQLLQGLLSARLSQQIVRRMREELFGRIIDLPIAYLDAHSHGDVMSRMTNDIENISTTVSQSLPSLFSGVLTIVGTVAVMLGICWQLALLSLATVLLTVAATRFLSRRVRRYSREKQALLGQLNGAVEEGVSGYRTVVAYNHQAETARAFCETADALTRAGIRTDVFSGVMGPVMNCIGNIGFVIIAAFGGYFALHRMISVGVISAFIVYARQFSRPINEIAQVYGQLQTAIAGAERVFAVLDEAPEDMAGEALEAGAEASVRFEHVNFSYVPGYPVLRDFTLTVPKGKKVALVGATGSGKTTVVNLLMRFYDVDSGEITLDHKPIKDLTRRSLRLNYSMVLQDTWLFTGTVYENIAYGSEKATREDVERVCKACGIHDYIRTLPAGYETVLEDDGANISKGQKQLMTIARAMLLESSLLILDEATSNVDTRMELRIQKAMRTLMADKTCFVIAHRLSTIRNADMILVVRDGEIVERGTHESLMQGDTFYRHLYNAQFA